MDALDRQRQFCCGAYTRCANFGAQIGNVVKDKDPIQVEIAQALADGRLRMALVVNAEGIAVQHVDSSPPEEWFISQEVPDAFVRYIEQNSAAIECRSSIYLVHPTVPVLNIVYRTAAWHHCTVLPLLGDTVVNLLRATLTTGELRVRFNADDGELAMQVPFADAADLGKALAIAELRGSPTLAGYESLMVLAAAHDQLKHGSTDADSSDGSPRQVVAAAVELPETHGALVLLQRSLRGEANH